MSLRNHPTKARGSGRDGESTQGVVRLLRPPRELTLWAQGRVRSSGWKENFLPGNCPAGDPACAPQPRREDVRAHLSHAGRRSCWSWPPWPPAPHGTPAWPALPGTRVPAAADLLAVPHFTPGASMGSWAPNTCGVLPEPPRSPTPLRLQARAKRGLACPRAPERGSESNS